MRCIGFSTGALALGDFRTALAWLRKSQSDAIELSALRLSELDSLLAAIPDLDLKQFRYKAIHAPADVTSAEEAEVAGKLLRISRRDFSIVVHPDAIHEPRHWSALGSRLCVENMDKRKPSGRTVDELRVVFDALPRASMCLDLAHVRQVDSSMVEAYRFVREFGKRLRQVHISELNTNSKHIRMSTSAMADYVSVISLIPSTLPIIIEAQLPYVEIDNELDAVRQLFATHARKDWAATAG